jgi:hypothetical protein
MTMIKTVTETGPPRPQQHHQDPRLQLQPLLVILRPQLQLLFLRQPLQLLVAEDPLPQPLLEVHLQQLQMYPTSIYNNAMRRSLLIFFLNLQEDTLENFNPCIITCQLLKYNHC